jgi:hypothetical protein
MLCLATGTAHASEPCDLDVKILKTNRLHVLEMCNGVEMYNENLIIYFPRGEQYHDDAHECRLLNVEQVDRSAVNVLNYCEYRVGGKKSVLAIQAPGDRILITNTENY